MSYRVYTTDAIVLGTREHGEDSRLISLVTRDVGVVSAKAQGVRKIASKYRGHLLRFGSGSVDLIRGKEYWKLIGAAMVTPALEANEWSTAMRVAKLVSQLSYDGGPQPGLYDALVWFLGALPGSGKRHKTIEIMAVLSVLEALGYWNPNDFDITACRDSDDMALVVDREKELVRLINTVLQETQLVHESRT